MQKTNLDLEKKPKKMKQETSKKQKASSVKKQRSIPEQSGEEKASSSFMECPGLVCFISTEGFLSKLNPPWVSLTGYSLNDLVSRPLTDFLHPDDVTIFKKKITICFSEKTTVSFSSRMRCKDGSFRSLEWVLQGGDHQGSLLAVAKDITEFLEVKELLSKSEKFFQSVLESTGIGLLIVDTSGNIIQMNNKFVKMWGIPEEIASRKDDQITWGFILEKVNEPNLFRERILDLLQTREISKDIISLCDGRVFERTSHPQLIDGEIAGRSWGFQDITNRIRVEEALKESEKNFRSLAEFSPIMIFINIKGRVVYVNQLCVSLMGYSREEFYSDDFYFLSITAPEYQNLVKEKFREHMQGKETKPYEYAVITKSGKKLHTVLSTKLINFSGEKAILGMITDITEVKTAQMENERINIELSKINSTKDKFFSIIAHDLKTPFNTIFWFSQSLIRDIPNLNLEELITKAELIRDSSKQAYLLVENLLLWAQTQDRTIPFNPEKIDLLAIILENIEMFSHQIREKNIRLTNYVTENIFVLADINMIRTVIRNLLANAVQFTPPEGLIEILVTEGKDEVEFRIRDSGIGIDNEKLQSIFQIETKRNISSSDQHKGSGLGLIICKEFIERHGGNIRVESEQGKGSTFLFSIPKSIPENL